MKVGISLLSSERLLAGLQVKKSIEPQPTQKEMRFQPIVIITIGFVFGYMDVIFNNGKSIGEEEMISEFGFESFKIDNEQNEE